MTIGRETQSGEETGAANQPERPEGGIDVPIQRPGDLPIEGFGGRVLKVVGVSPELAGGLKTRATGLMALAMTEATEVARQENTWRPPATAADYDETEADGAEDW